jgi:hypothetical protein
VSCSLHTCFLSVLQLSLPVLPHTQIRFWSWHNMLCRGQKLGGQTGAGYVYTCMEVGSTPSTHTSTRALCEILRHIEASYLNVLPSSEQRSSSSVHLREHTQHPSKAFGCCRQVFAQTCLRVVDVQYAGQSRDEGSSGHCTSSTRTLAVVSKPEKLFKT